MLRSLSCWVITVTAVAAAGFTAAHLGLLPGPVNTALGRLFDHVPAGPLGWTLIGLGLITGGLVHLRTPPKRRGRHRRDT